MERTRHTRRARIHGVPIASYPVAVSAALERLGTSLDDVHQVVTNGQRPIEIVDRAALAAEQRLRHTTGVERLGPLRRRGHQVLGILKPPYRVAGRGAGQ